MLPKTYTCTFQGRKPILVTAEISLTRGRYGIKILGLPGRAVKESWARIFTSFRNMRLYPPPKKVIVNLAPADIHKLGSHFDVPIAVGILAAAGMIKADLLDQYLLAGELSLDGSLQAIRNEQMYMDAAKEFGFKGVILAGSESQTKIDGIEVVSVVHFSQVMQVLNSEPIQSLSIPKPTPFADPVYRHESDFLQVKGQTMSKRALEISVAGGHSVCMIGPPGSGKTFLASCIPSIFPPCSEQEQRDLARIYGQIGKSPPLARPFIAPHHRISLRALVGGGKKKNTGALAMAHHGVLFLDELTEFSSEVLQALTHVLDRSPSVLLITAFNPCSCGYANHSHQACHCSPAQIRRYQQRIPRSLMDRMDMKIQLDPVSYVDMVQSEVEESSKDIRERVSRVRDLQRKRLHAYPVIHCNGMIPSSLVKTLCPIDNQGQAVLTIGMREGQLSARAYDRTLKVARTIADLAGKEQIAPEHIAEAIQYRSLDRESWVG